MRTGANWGHEKVVCNIKEFLRQKWSTISSATERGCINQDTFGCK